MGENRGSGIVGEIFIKGTYYTLFLIVFNGFGGADISVMCQLSPLIASVIFFIIMVIIAAIRISIRNRESGDE